MKSIAVLMLAAGIAAAQTNEAHYAVLRTLDGEAFTNATVTKMNAVFAIVDFDSGGKKVAFTNLPLEIQQRFGFDNAKAQAEIDLAERKKQASEQHQLDAINARQDGEKDRLFRYVDDRLVAIAEFQELNGQVTALKFQRMRLEHNLEFRAG